MNPSVIAACLFGFAVVAFCMTPVIAVLTAHQRKMAELLQGNREGNSGQLLTQVLAENQQMRAELEGLRDKVNRQAIAQDESLASRITQADLQQRL